MPDHPESDHRDPNNLESNLENDVERLRTAVDAAGVGTWDFYPWTGALIWSERCKQLFGLPPDADVDYGVFLGGLHPDDRERADRVVQQAIAPGSAGFVDFEYRTIGPEDGRLRWVRSTGRALFERPGAAATRFIGTVIEITERKERELQERRLSQIAESSADFIGYSAPDGRALYLNPAGLALVGLADLDEARSHTLDDFFTPEDRELLRTQVLPAVELHGRWVGEFRFRHFRSGRAIPVHYNLFRVNDPATGEVAGYATVSVDLTRRKRAEEDYRFLADSVPQLLSTLNARGDITYVNRSAREFTGRTHEELCLGWIDLVHPDDAARVRAAWDQAIATGRRYQLEFRLRRRDGMYRWLALDAAPQFDAEGRVLQWVRASTDIHDVKVALQNFQDLADTIPQFIWTTDPDGYHDYFNRRWTEFTGFEPHASQGTEMWNRLLHPDDQARARDRWAHSLRTGEFYEIEYRFRRHDGEYRWFLGQARPIHDGAGRIVRWFGTCTDIHEQRLLKEQLQRSYEDLELKVTFRNLDLERQLVAANQRIAELEAQLLTKT